MVADRGAAPAGQAASPEEARAGKGVIASTDVPGGPDDETQHSPVGTAGPSAHPATSGNGVGSGGLPARDGASAGSPAPVRERASGGGQSEATVPAVPVAQERRRTVVFRVLIALLLIVPPVAAGLLSALQAPMYEAQADVLFEASNAPDAASAERQLATQQVLLQSRPVIGAAAAATGMDAEELAEDIEVEVLEQSSVMRVSVQDQDRARAVAAATALMDQYLVAVREQVRASSTATREQELLQPRIDELSAQLGQLTTRATELGAGPDSSAVQLELSGLQGEAQIVRQELADLRANLLDAQLRGLEQDIGRARVLAAPIVEDDPVAPQPLRAAAAGLLLGAVLALALVAVLYNRRGGSRHSAPLQRR